MDSVWFSEGRKCVFREESVCFYGDFQSKITVYTVFFGREVGCLGEFCKGIVSFGLSHISFTFFVKDRNYLYFYVIDLSNHYK